MDAKDFLKMNEQMIAFNTLMKGELAKETAAAKAAVDLLGGAKAIEASQAILGAEQQRLDVLEASIAARTVTIEQLLKDRSAELDVSDLELQVGKAALETAQLTFDVFKEEQIDKFNQLRSNLDQERESLKVALEQLESDRIALDKGFALIASKELAVSQKLAAMKAIV